MLRKEIHGDNYCGNLGADYAETLEKSVGNGRYTAAIHVVEGDEYHSFGVLAGYYTCLSGSEGSGGHPRRKQELVDYRGPSYENQVAYTREPRGEKGWEPWKSDFWWFRLLHVKTSPRLVGVSEEDHNYRLNEENYKRTGQPIETRHRERYKKENPQEITPWDPAEEGEE